MTKIRVLALALCMFGFASSACAKTITLVADVWCPYNCVARSEAPGFLIEVTQKAFERRGITVEYVTMSWDKAIDEARAGKYSGIVGASQNDAPDFIFPNLEQGWMSNQFFVKKDSGWRYFGKDSLSKVILGIASGYTYGPTVDNYIRANKNNPSRIQIESGDAVLTTNVAKLLEGKVTAVLEDTHVMNYYLAKNKLEGKIESAGQLPVSDQNNLYIAFSPKEKSAKYYASIMAEEMATMRESGELQKILSKYSVKDWRK